MGDLINNHEMFKKLGFDSANQWILYDERFAKFFDFFAQNISDSNLLTEHEVMERDELLQREEYLDATERHKQMQQLEDENPEFLDCNENQLAALQQEIIALEQADNNYAELVTEMRETKNEINQELCELEDKMNQLHHKEKILMLSCQQKSKELEELQRDNYKLSNEAKQSFGKIQSPPLFIHQLPLDLYFLKCDSFMQYFTLYLKDNFKIQECAELDNSDSEIHEITQKFEVLAKSIEFYTMAYIKTKAKAKATQSLIDQLDLAQIHVISLADMERETHELKLVTEHYLINTHETLMNDLIMHVQQRMQQRMELILYENTKLKLERAFQRHENDKQLTQIIADALSNAELVWITIQLDLEKKRNRFDNVEQMNTETAACMKRIKAMQAVQATKMREGTMCAMVVEKIAELLTQHLGQRVSREPKACLYEYEKFCRLSNYAFNGMVNRKAFASTLEQLQELNRLENILHPLVYDSPVEKPMFENVNFLKPFFQTKIKQQHIDKSLRNLRTLFQEQISGRLDKDKFWRYSQLLWIWFLTEPKRVLMAIDEVKKAAAKVPSITGIKSLSGIKRK